MRLAFALETVGRASRPPVAILLLPVVLAGCVNFQSEIKDRTELTGPARGDLGRELAIQVRGADAVLAAGLVEALASDLENGDLFDEVVLAPDAAPVASGMSAARLEIAVGATRCDTIHDFWRQRDGYVARYELTCTLYDRSGQSVLSGDVSGIGYDDETDPDKLSEDKRKDIRAAACHDAALKIGRYLRRAADEKANAALKALEKIHLPRGVGPVRVASLGFDDDPAARRRRGSELTRAVAGALQRLGPDLDVALPEEVEAELSADPEARPSSYEKLKSNELDRFVYRLGMRYYVVGRVSADGNRVEATATLRATAADAASTASAKASAEGPGALSLVAVELAKQLGAELEKNPPQALPKPEEKD